MKFETYFRASSYTMIAVGALALVVSGGIGPALTLVCALVLGAAWRAEGSRWRISERIGLVIVLLSLPLFYFDWRYLLGTGLAREKVGVTALAHLILFLSAVKLWQEKADRDWVFLYLISFFEVLLAAGLSISPLFFLTLLLYVLAALSTIIAFEIHQGRRRNDFEQLQQPNADAEEPRLLALTNTLSARRQARFARGPARRLPFVAALMLFLILGLAAPLFLVMPRSSEAQMTRLSGGLAGFTGFSDTVKLGDVGQLKQSDQVVMRVRVENPPPQPLRWRGVALDEFTGLVWRKSKTANPYNAQRNLENGFYPVDNGPRSGQPLTKQTFYVEPLDTAVIFAAPRVIALQGNLPYLRVDAESGLSSRLHDFERVTYTVFSDTAEPDAAILRREQPLYGPAYQRYLQRPERLDPRIEELTRRVLDRARPTSMYDAARAIETHLQTDYGYSLDLKASGDNALGDFLFNVRAGHCEYFASAMVVMLRTQGIAARLVNGFQTGTYNSTSEAYTVTQRDAHSWVEVYFPQSNAWVTFDPTPPAGRNGNAAPTGLTGRLGQYGEALEMLWIQYVVGYDKSEQRSLTTTAVKRAESLWQQATALYESGTKRVQNWYKSTPSLPQMPRTESFTCWHWLFGALSLMLLGCAFWLWGARFWAWLLRRLGRQTRSASVVEFYERMLKLLAQQGLQRAPHETPLEFARAVGQPMPARITEAYHRVRYGAHHLTAAEAQEIETWLREIEEKKS